MKKERLVCDKRNGCVAIYRESDKDKTNGCHSSDDRNIAYSSKGAEFNGTHWVMDTDTQEIFQDMVDAFNKKITKEK